MDDDTRITEYEAEIAKLVWARLVHAVGKEHAITLQELADHIGVSRRQVEHVIELHLVAAPFLIVAGSKGYYRPTTGEQINEYVKSLHSRHRRMQLREAAVKRKARAEGWAEELGRFVAPPAAKQTELFA